VLREHEAGAETVDLVRKHGVSEATLYNGRRSSAGWKSKAKRLRHLKDENAKLKKLLAEQMLDAAALFYKMVGPVTKREAVAHLQPVTGLPGRQACGIVSADRRMVRYRSCQPPATELRGQLRELGKARRRFGHRQLFVYCATRARRPGGTGSTV
jgi:hypothetical protein